jgi:hypothetical protein
VIAFAEPEQNRGWVGMHVETLDRKTQRVCDLEFYFPVHPTDLLLDGRFQRVPSPFFFHLKGEYLRLSRAMNLGGFLDGKAQQPLPPAFIDHEPELYAFQKYCQNLMNKILDLFAIGLEVRLLTYPRAFVMDFFPLHAKF